MTIEEAMKIVEEWGMISPPKNSEAWKVLKPEIKKRIPKKIIKKIEPVYNVDCYYYKCSTCSNRIESYNEYADYCPACGQKLDWSEDGWQRKL